MASREFTYTVLFEPAAEGGYVVTCPALPGLVTEGDSLEEARAMAADAIRGYLESLVKDGEAIPADRAAEPITEKVKVIVPPPLQTPRQAGAAGDRAVPHERSQTRDPGRHHQGS